MCAGASHAVLVHDVPDTYRLWDRMRALRDAMSLRWRCRSTIDVGAEWQPGVEKVTRPALVLWSKDDPYVTRVTFHIPVPHFRW